MPDKAPPKGPIGKFLALPADSVAKTLLVAVTLCLFASMAVSAVAVSLRPTQEVNKLLDKQVNILQVAGVHEDGIDVAEAFGQFETQILELETGEFSAELDVLTYDARAAADDPLLSVELDSDPASIGRKPKFQTIYILRNEDGTVDKAILPIHGYGLWSTLYGFIAVEENGNDIFGLQFYEHAETAGLGAEVDNPRWKALWSGKKLADENGDLQITVGKVAPDAGNEYFVDGLAGATLTSVGVHNMVRFWMAEEGYGPFLEKLKDGDV